MNQVHRIRNDDALFRTQSNEKIENSPDMNITVLGGNLFISGISAPVSILRERKPPAPKYKAPLPKTRKSKAIMNNSSIPPIHGFGNTNMRYITESVLSGK